MTEPTQNTTPKLIVNNPQVVAFEDETALWIPFIAGRSPLTPDARRMKDIIDELVQKTGKTRIHFTSVVSSQLVLKLHGFKPEHHWFKEAQENVLCLVGDWHH